MQLTRRDALKLAAGLAAAAGVPSALTPAQSSTLLDAPLDPPLPAVGRAFAGLNDTEMYDAIAFAEVLDGLVCPEMCRLTAPDELAEYYQARRDVLRDLPILQSVPFDHAWHKMDEATLALGVVSWMSGVRAGASYEALRQSLVGPKRVCPTCGGIGSVGAEHSPYDPAGGPEVCPDCRGNGTVATPAPRLAIAPA